jgi:hypothetical protein
LAGGDPAKARQLPVTSLIIAGGCAGVAYVLSSYPLDVIKSVIQTSAEPLTIRQAVSRIMRTNGARGFAAGLAPGILRAIPAASSTFVTYEFVRTRLG